MLVYYIFCLCNFLPCYTRRRWSLRVRGPDVYDSPRSPRLPSLQPLVQQPATIRSRFSFACLLFPLFLPFYRFFRLFHSLPFQFIRENVMLRAKCEIFSVSLSSSVPKICHFAKKLSSPIILLFTFRLTFVTPYEHPRRNLMQKLTCAT